MSSKRLTKHRSIDPAPGAVVPLSRAVVCTVHRLRSDIRRYVRQADVLLDLIHGDRTRRSARGLYSRLASDSADDSVFAERMLMPGSGYSCI